MAVDRLKKYWKNDFVQTAAIIGLIIAIVLGLFFGAQLALNTPYPTLTVETGSMCVPFGSECDGWSHPFNQTLHVGDLLIVQGVDPSTLNTDYPNSDVIVFHDPGNSNRLIVHRIAAVQNVNGTIFFQTKGDGNGGQDFLWPTIPTEKQYDNWVSKRGIPENLVVGKVIARVPWVGNLTLFLRQNPIGLPVVIVVIMLLVILQFIIPIVKKNTLNKTIQKSKHRCLYKVCIS